MSTKSRHDLRRLKHGGKIDRENSHRRGAHSRNYTYDGDAEGSVPRSGQNWVGTISNYSMILFFESASIL
jgi:hypothetical protein